MVRLNIGCGPNVFPHDGWINYDREDISGYISAIKGIYNVSMMPDHQKNLVRYLQSGGTINFHVHDLVKGFAQHADGTIDGIYLGQMIEHLNPVYQIPTFLNECYRMLKPGGVIRMTTPDLDLLIKAYQTNDMDKFAIEQPAFYKDADPSAQLAYLMYGACGPNCTFSNYEGHMFLFTQKSMTKMLTNARFKNPTYYYETGKSTDPIIQKEVVDAGMSHSFIVEAVK